MSHPGHRAVEFFEEQFRRQVEERAFALNPFEITALAHVRGSVLDLGCGLGNLALEAARLGCEVVAVDASRTAVEYVRQTAFAQGLSVRAVEADLSTHEIGGSFDCVFAIGVLMFFERARALALLRAVRSAVRPGGVAVVNTLIEGTTFRAMFDPEHHYLFGPTELERAFSDWAVLESRVDRFPAPGDSVKVFSTIVARRPLAE